MAFPNGYPFSLAAACLCALLSAASCQAIEDRTVDGAITIERVIVRTMQEIDMPALRAGLMEEVYRREGQAVAAGEVVAKLQDRQAVFAVEQAETQAKTARHLADNRLDLETAQKKLEQALQAVKQQELDLEALRLEAENPLRSQAAEKSQAVPCDICG